MRLIEHIRRAETWNPTQFGIDQLIKYKEQLKRLYRARIEIIVAILAVVKVKPAEFAELDQPRHYLLDIYIRSVMSQIDEALCPFAQFASAVIAGPPIVNDCRVEGRFVHLVFEEEFPIIRDGGIYLFQRPQV